MRADYLCQAHKKLMEHSNLNGIEIGLLIKKHVDDLVPSLWIVEVHKESPVHEPSALSNKLPLSVEGIRVNVGSQLLKIILRVLPFLERKTVMNGMRYKLERESQKRACQREHVDSWDHAAAQANGNSRGRETQRSSFRTRIGSERT